MNLSLDGCGPGVWGDRKTDYFLRTSKFGDIGLKLYTYGFDETVLKYSTKGNRENVQVYTVTSQSNSSYEIRPCMK